MKKIVIGFGLTMIIMVNSSAQNSFMQYKGKTWEQLNGNGVITILQPQITPFTVLFLDHINVQTTIEASAENYSLQIMVDENLQKFYKVQQKEDTLRIYCDLSGGTYNRWISSNNIRIHLKTPMLHNIYNKGNSTILVNGITQNEFSVQNEGNSKWQLNGKLTVFNFWSSGNSTVDARSLLTEKVNLSSNGNGNFTWNALEVAELSMQGNNKWNNIQQSGTTINQKEAELQSPSERDIYTAEETITIKLKNTGFLPKKITLISYKPNETGNGTMGFVLLPKVSKSCRFPIGTKIYLANTDQVNTVMGGSRISNETPFLVVKASDNKKVFPIK